MNGHIDQNHPCFAIGVAARMVGLHAQTLRTYEKEGLIKPSRTKGKSRLYSQRDIQRVMRIRSLTEDLGANLAGVEVILRMSDQMDRMEEDLHELRGRLEKALAGPKILSDGKR